MEISDDLRCVFSAEVEEQDGSYVIEVPKREVDLNALRPEQVYRVAILGRHTGSSEGALSENESDASTDGDADEVNGAATAAGSDDPDAEGSPRGPHADRTDGPNDTNGTSTSTAEPEPPVDRGDEVTVDIEGIGDQGDGIARVDRGYVIIVPDTEKGERVRIQITSVKQNVAFAEVVDRIEHHHYE
ncbi:TRAM domain-containing protein [Halobaculum halobium]|uniref:TRAM domain-containing protein n=1 Tax=Halobaculum halobium TaxID=3032281 RepID=A0ABD5T5B7_9EURY|nr:TRAM domain-containing protein [Halobaculum sp. SYNS20]